MQQIRLLVPWLIDLWTHQGTTIHTDESAGTSVVIRRGREVLVLDGLRPDSRIPPFYMRTYLLTPAARAKLVAELTAGRHALHFHGPSLVG